MFGVSGMNEFNLLLSVLGAAAVLGVVFGWGLWRGRRERQKNNDQARPLLPFTPVDNLTAALVDLTANYKPTQISVCSYTGETFYNHFFGNRSTFGFGARVLVKHPGGPWGLIAPGVATGRISDIYKYAKGLATNTRFINIREELKGYQSYPDRILLLASLPDGDMVGFVGDYDCRIEDGGVDYSSGGSPIIKIDGRHPTGRKYLQLLLAQFDRQWQEAGPIEEREAQQVPVSAKVCADGMSEQPTA